MQRAVGLSQVLLATLLIALVLAVADVLIITLTILLLIFAGVVFGIFLNTISRCVKRYTSLSYRWSYTIVVLLLISLTAAGFYYMGWQIAEQVTELTTQLRESAKKATEYIRQYDWAQQYLREPSQLQNRVTDGILPRVLQGVQSLAGAITGLLVIFFVGLYAAFDPDVYRSGMVKLVPSDRRDRASEVLESLNSALAHWLLGRLISMAIVGVLTTLGLWLLGVPLPVALRAIAALLTFIPNIGPVLATIPQALLALEVGGNTVLYVIVFNIALQTLESYLITPIVQQYTVTLQPVATIFAQLLMGVVVGVMGIIMAAPLATAVMVLVQMLYVQDRLGDANAGRFA